MSTELILAWPPKQLSPNARLHWAAKSKAAKAYRADCYTIAKLSGIKIDWEGDIHVWIDFYPPDRRGRDDDNIISSFKAGRDGVAEALGVNDKRFRIYPLVWSEPVKGGEVRLRFTPGAEQ